MSSLGRNNDQPPGPGASLPPEPEVIEPREFEEAVGEPLARVLDLDSWHPGEELAALYARLEREIGEAVRQQRRARPRIRGEVFPRLRSRGGAPEAAGVWTPPRGVEDIERIHRGLLLNGGVEACDGTSALHDTLPLTIAQL